MQISTMRKGWFSLQIFIDFDCLGRQLCPSSYYKHSNTERRFFMLTGKTALVTGSTSGIGLGIAKALAAQGATLILNGFGDHEGPAQEVQSAAQTAGYQTRNGYHGADLSKAAEIEAMMAYAQAEFGGVDILVNNAGIQHTAAIEQFPTDKWDAILAINLTSSFHTTRLALPGMRAKNWGRIINLASVHGLVASKEKAAYVAAKHGLVGFTKVTALETALTPITCNAICPGWVLTPLVQKQIDARSLSEGKDQATTIKNMLSEKQPSQQFVTPADIGAMAVFLCSAAGNNIRGESLGMNGGWTAQ